ncbi:hypothetical protein HX99_06240 [Peptococcaceae bacterium SCADC1_2_3]|jgi:hypothetical protein|nr:hypothetical protein DK28_0202335 [Peptococcaceae bacterium SCADC1_2_3]KFI35299.1 hypothetical protein HX99_06240 [Peptococcaceae bacterium SCADC1_2_3]KFI35434.1 hypothetical protein HY00_04955 [Peptococcaceae bacterium SCADC1_2_3]KFI37007.1 hypothetical protein HY02_10360 [Peptococcaceae bacterium SCADC1_2_3]
MSTRLNLDLKDEKLYKVIKIRAVQEGMTVREIVTQALQQWLESRPGRPVTRLAVAMLNEMREKIFGERVLPGHAADFIRQVREERTSRL